MAIALTIILSVVAFVILDFIGLFLRLLLGLSLIGIISPFYEEPIKILGPVLIGLFFAGTFRSKKYGAILGAVAGAVFGLLEISDYWVLFQPFVTAGIISPGMVIGNIVVRLFTSLPMHVIASLIAGLGVSYAAMSSLKPRLRDFYSGNALTFILVAIGFHFVYNISNLIPSFLGAVLIGIILAFLVMLAGIYLAFRVYGIIPEKLDEMAPIGARDLVAMALGRRAKKSVPMPRKQP